MFVMLENVNLENNGGPNSFAKKLVHEFEVLGVDYGPRDGDVSLCFIESHRKDLKSKPLVQRLDGIYFNLEQPYERQNANIKRTYDAADGVIFQSEFSKKLVTTWFGDHDNSHVIHNGANLDLINKVSVGWEASILDKCQDIWCCAASWRPHKRLKENIRYFQEHSSPTDILFIAGDLQGQKIPKDDKIKYLGVLNQESLIKLYKTCTKFIHLAWLDNCPNVVVDARACGCEIICSNSGGTPEIAGPSATVVDMKPWDYKPSKLYDPPSLDFSKKFKNSHNIEYDMHNIAKQYLNVLGEFCEKFKRI